MSGTPGHESGMPDRRRGSPRAAALLSMAPTFLFGILLAAQDSALAERLKRDGGKAVEELSTTPSAKPALEALAGGDDAELKWWAGAALAEIDAREKAGPDFVHPRRITLEAKDRPAHEVLAEILAGEKFRLAGDLGPARNEVNVAFLETPFLAAVDEVCRQAGCALQRRPDGSFEVKADPLRFGPPIAYAGPQAYVVTGITHRSKAEFRGDPVHRLEIGLAVRTDPRAWIRPRACDWEFVSAVDDTGATLEVESGSSRGWSGDHQPPTITLQASVAMPGKTASKIARLRMIARVTLCRSPRELVWDDVLKAEGQMREAGPIRITLRRMTFEDRKYMVLLDCAPKDAPGLPDLNDLVLEDSEGRRFSSGSGGSGEGSLFREFQPWGQTQTPARLRLTALPGLQERRIYVELRDIPIR